MKAQLALLAIVLVQVSGRPETSRTKSVDLRDAMDKTVCPIRVVLDIEEGRVPRVIKTIRCATGGARHCCHAHGTAACTELRDDVLVYYPHGAPGLGDVKTAKRTVAVGCVCMMQEFSEGYTTPDPDHSR